MLPREDNTFPPIGPMACKAMLLCCIDTVFPLPAEPKGFQGTKQILRITVYRQTHTHQEEFTGHQVKALWAQTASFYNQPSSKTGKTLSTKQLDLVLPPQEYVLCLSTALNGKHL